MDNHPDRPESTGGQGDNLRLSRSDMALLRKAARERWGVPDPVKTEVIFQLTRVLVTSEDERHRIAAARTLGALDRVDQADERLAVERAKNPNGPDAAGDVKALRDFLRDDHEGLAEGEGQAPG